MTDEAELLRAWRRGDQAAGNRLITRHFSGVFRFFDSKIPDAAEDLTQQTFLGCAESVDRLEKATSFKAFLYAIARHRLLDHLKTKYRRPAVDPLAQSLIDVASSPSGTVQRTQVRELLQDALNTLPIDLQIAVELHYWEGLSIREVADVLRLPAGTVKSKLARARELLQDRIVDMQLPWERG